MSKEKYKAKLKESGISDATAKAARLRYLPDASRHARHLRAVPAMLIPYHAPDGRLIKDRWRVRYLNPPEGVGKYAQAVGTAPWVYFPPLRSVNWNLILSDPETPRMCTEGELKALKACQEGIPCFGLGGVSSFRSKRLSRPLLDDLERFEWQESSIDLVYDSDHRHKLEVQRAAHALGRELLSRGARVFVTALPELEEGRTTGLDDFLVARGFSALSGVLRVDDHSEFSLSHELWKMNAELAYVDAPDPMIVVLGTGEKRRLSAFERGTWRNHYYHALDKDGKLVKKPAAPAWIGWECRRELSGFVFEPSLPPGPTEDGCYNVWKGFAVDATKGDVSPWLRLLEHLFGKGTVEVRFIEAWFAYLVRCPGSRMEVGVCVVGPQGVGKSRLAKPVSRLLGRSAVEADESRLTSEFTGWKEGVVLCVGNEITGRHPRARAELVKNMISDEVVTVNEKFVPAYDVPNRVNYYLTSNYEGALALDPDDRRYFVAATSRGKLPAEFWRGYHPWAASEEGAAALRWHLEHVDLTGFDPYSQPPWTEAKRLMVTTGASDRESFALSLTADPDSACSVGGVPLLGDLFTAEQLLGRYRALHPEDRSANERVVAQALRRAGVPHRKVWQRVDGRRLTLGLWAVRDGAAWETRSDKRWLDHWWKNFGTSDGGKS